LKSEQFLSANGVLVGVAGLGVEEGRAVGVEEGGLEVAVGATAWVVAVGSIGTLGTVVLTRTEVPLDDVAVG
jgi:hypothetical protein